MTDPLAADPLAVYLDPHALPEPMTLDELRAVTTVGVDQAAAVLGISRSAAYRLAKRGDLPVIRLGRGVRISAPALVALIVNA